MSVIATINVQRYFILIVASVDYITQPFMENDLQKQVIQKASELICFRYQNLFNIQKFGGVVTHFTFKEVSKLLHNSFTYETLKRTLAC